MERVAVRLVAEEHGRFVVESAPHQLVSLTPRQEIKPVIESKASTVGPRCTFEKAVESQTVAKTTFKVNTGSTHQASLCTSCNDT